MCVGQRNIFVSEIYLVLFRKCNIEKELHILNVYIIRKYFKI
jgi:hypothetical protein